MMNSSYVGKCLLFMLSISQLFLMIVLPAQAGESIYSKDDRIKVIYQESFNPPNSGKPKGSSGSGSRRLSYFVK